MVGDLSSPPIFLFMIAFLNIFLLQIQCHEYNQDVSSKTSPIKRKQLKILSIGSNLRTVEEILGFFDVVEPNGLNLVIFEPKDEMIDHLSRYLDAHKQFISSTIINTEPCSFSGSGSFIQIQGVSRKEYTEPLTFNEKGESFGIHQNIESARVQCSTLEWTFHLMNWSIHEIEMIIFNESGNIEMFDAILDFPGLKADFLLLNNDHHMTSSHFISEIISLDSHNYACAYHYHYRPSIECVLKKNILQSTFFANGITWHQLENAQLATCNAMDFSEQECQIFESEIRQIWETNTAIEHLDIIPFSMNIYGQNFFIPIVLIPETPNATADFYTQKLMAEICNRDFNPTVLQCCYEKEKCEMYLNWKKEITDMIVHGFHLHDPKAALTIRRQEKDEFTLALDEIIQKVTHNRNVTVNIVQIGAHVGATKYDPIFPHLYTDSRLQGVLFEPLPLHFGELKKNYASADDRIHFVNAAVCDEPGKITLQISQPPDDIMTNANSVKNYFYRSLHSGSAGEKQPFSKDNKNFLTTQWDSTLVDCVTLDSIFQAFGLHPSEIHVLVSDCEGCDGKAILQALNLPGMQPGVILFEHHLTPEDILLQLLLRLDKLDYRCEFQSNIDTMCQLDRMAEDKTQLAFNHHFWKWQGNALISVCYEFIGLGKETCKAMLENEHILSVLSSAKLGETYIEMHYNDKTQSVEWGMKPEATVLSKSK